MRRRRTVTSTVGIMVLVLLTLQIFLLTVGLDALLAGQKGQAWAAAGFSVLLAAGSAGFYRYLRGA
jgi:hypothetical protein